MKSFELSRSEREANKPTNWGEIFFKKTQLLELQGKLGTQKGGSKSLTWRKTLGGDADQYEIDVVMQGMEVTDGSMTPPRAAVRQAMESCVVSSNVAMPLDASAIINPFYRDMDEGAGAGSGRDIGSSISEDEQCDFFRRYEGCRILVLKGWQEVSLNVLRCISMTFSETLQELDLSYSHVNPVHLDLLLVRATKIKILKFNHCPTLDSICMNVLVKLVARSVTELFVSGCELMRNEALVKISQFTRLKSLDLSGCDVNDGNLCSIVKSCKRLTFLNLTGCQDLTDQSLVEVARNCKHLHLLNISGLSKATNKTCMAISQHCREMISLNMSKLLLVSDKGINAIARGCPSLQALNIAGVPKISEEAVHTLATSCLSLLMLNLTGCERISYAGLQALIAGLPFVEKGLSFVGFRPRDGHVALKLEGHLKMLQDDANREVAEKRRRQQEEERRVEEEWSDKVNAASAVIQDYMRRYKQRMYFYGLWRKRVKRMSAGLLQRTWRGNRGRHRFLLRQQEHREFLSQTPFAITISRYVRGHLSRLANAHVANSMREMYIIRRQEAEIAVTVKLQSIGRRYLGVKRTYAWRELVQRRELNRHHAISSMQQTARMFIARTRVKNIRLNAVILKELRLNAKTRLRRWVIGVMWEYKSKLSGDAYQHYFRKKWEKAITLQRAYRGFRARETVLHTRIRLAAVHRGAISIQRIFRGTRILAWKDMRLNIIAAFVLDRQYLERRGSVEQSRLRYKAYIEDNRRDSASEPDDDDEDIEWFKGFDAHRGRHFWSNYLNNEITFDEPFKKLAQEKGMIGHRIKVYWVVQKCWYEGTITQYHKRKQRHKVEYDDGDHEWINLNYECDRVQIQLPDGTWVVYLLFHSEGRQAENQKGLQHIEDTSFKETAFRDASQWKPFIDDHTKEIMFISQITGELRTGIANATNWVVQDDGFGFPCFFNINSSETVYEDPRFLYDVQKDLARQRAFVMQELRYAQYFCQDFFDRYSALAGSLPAKQRTLDHLLIEARNSPKPKHLHSFVIRAKTLYQQVSVLDQKMDDEVWEEINYAAWLSQQMKVILDEAEKYTLNRADNKRKIVDKLTENSGQQVFCRNCKRETKRHLEYCPTCGKAQILFITENPKAKPNPGP